MYIVNRFSILLKQENKFDLVRYLAQDTDRVFRVLRAPKSTIESHSYTFSCKMRSRILNSTYLVN